MEKDTGIFGKERGRTQEEDMGEDAFLVVQTIKISRESKPLL